MNADRPTPPRRSRARTLLRWGRGILILAVIGVAGKFVEQLVVRHLANEEVKRAVADLDRNDPGWTFDEIQARRKNIPDEKNGAKRVVIAYELLPKPWPGWGDNPVVAGGLGLEEDDHEYFGDPPWQRDPRYLPEGKRLKSLRSELGRANAALKEALALDQFPDGRYDIVWKVDFLNTMLPRIQHSREVVQLLDLESVLRCCDGDVNGACRCARGALHVAQSHGDEINVISLIVRFAEGTSAVTMLERALACGKPSVDLLKSLQDVLDRQSEEVPKVTLCAVRGERALYHRMWQAHAEGRISFARMFAQSEPESTWDKVVAFFSAPVLRRAHAEFLRSTTQLVEIAKQPAPEQEAGLRAWDERVMQVRAGSDRAQVLAALLMPAFTKILDISHGQQAVLRCAATALAAERYRQEKGNWPDTLDALVPTYLKQVPADPYDGKPLRLRRTDDGIIVYSIGPDRADNGGTLDREHPVDPGTDLGFQLWDAGQRGRKPAPK
jgi:hypothetical protein